MRNLLVIGLVWPEPNSSAAGTRMLQLMRTFVSHGYDVTFASAAAQSEWTFDVDLIGVKKAVIALNDPGFDAFVKALDPEIVLFDRFMTEEQFGWRVAANCPNAMRVLDTEDLHFLRRARQSAVGKNREMTQADLFSDTAKREIAAILRSDLSLVISEAEMDLLRETFRVDTALLHYLPFMVAQIDTDAVAAWPGFEKRQDFALIGNFLHEPNLDAVQYLKETIWPQISASLRNVSLKIYGAYVPQKALQLHRPDQNFYIMGRAENAAEVVANARVLLAPLRFGAGAKGKLLEAMQCGTPSVTTAIGAESMAGDLPWNGIIANDPARIAAAAIALYTDRSLWEQAQQRGNAIVNTRYSETLFESAFMRRVETVLADLKMHRLRNFTGAMLLHHTLTSTKYLSKWIEAKNK